MTRPTISLLIPAHNEEAVIGRCLSELALLPDPTQIETIVVCNGCTDNTAAVARASAPWATVLDEKTSGKVHALNVGIAQATADIIAFLDSDLEISGEQVLHLCQRLSESPDKLGACGRMHLDTSHSNWLVRQYYKAWQLGPYFRSGKFGGFFVLKREMTEWLFPLPKLTNDDEYIRRSIPAGGILFDPSVCFTAQAPRTVKALVHVRKRVLRGNRQLSGMGLASGQGGTGTTIARKGLSNPGLWIGVAMYLGVSAWVRLQMMRHQPENGHQWERDNTSRVAAAQER